MLPLSYYLNFISDAGFEKGRDKEIIVQTIKVL